MKNIWQGIACKFVVGAAALSLALFAGCGGDSSSGSDSGDDPVEESSSSGAESSDDGEDGSSGSEEIDESSSSKKADSSSSKKEEASSSSKKAKSSSSFNFGSSSSRKKTKDPTVVEKTCSVVEHTGTEKSLVATSENTIPTSGITFHNEFSKRNVGSATYYTDGSFKLVWDDDDADALARSQVMVKGTKTYSELGDISVEYTVALTGTATSSYVGASAYASSDDDMTTVALYVIEDYLDESELLTSGNKVGEFDHGDGRYVIYMFLDQMVTTSGTQKNYSYFVVRDELRLCGYLDMTAIFDEVVSAGAPEVPLRWVAVSAEIQEGGHATIDMQEAKINLDQGGSGDIDTSDAADEFCKVEHTHAGEAKDLVVDAELASGSVGLSVDGVDYVLEAYASGEGLATKYFDDGAFSMECSDAQQTECEVDLYREFATPVLYTDAGRINVEYSFSKQGAEGMSILGAHGYMQTRDSSYTLEFYVLEDWLESYPLAMNFGDKVGELTIDGSVYEVYQNCLSGNPKVRSCHLASVRKDKRRCGSVNLTAQISQWESMGVETSPLTKVSVMGLMTDGAYGTVDFSYANVSVAE